MNVKFPDNFCINAWYRGDRNIKVIHQDDKSIVMSNNDKLTQKGNDIYLNSHILTNMPDINAEDLARIYKYNLRKKGYKIFESVVSNTVYYHCSNNKFEEFNLSNNKTYKEFDIASWFFTKNLDYAKRYGKYVYECQLNIKKTFDTHKQLHHNMFIKYLNEQYNKNEIENILDEQTYNNRPYWTCADAFYCAKTHNFDSIIIEEELEQSIESIAIFDLKDIKILKIYDN